MRASLDPGVRGLSVSGAVAVDTGVLGGTHPAAMNRQNAAANALTAQLLIFMQSMDLAQLRPNIA
jgi:hypothetical protein